MFRFASDLTASLDDLQAQVTLALHTDPSPAAVSVSGAILERMHHAKSLCQSICDLTLKESPLAAMASPKRSKGVHAVVKAAYLPTPPRPEDDQVKMPGFHVVPRKNRKPLTNSGAEAGGGGHEVHAAAADEVSGRAQCDVRTPTRIMES